MYSNPGYIIQHHQDVPSNSRYHPRQRYRFRARSLRRADQTLRDHGEPGNEHQTGRMGVRQECQPKYVAHRIQ